MAVSKEHKKIMRDTDKLLKEYAFIRGKDYEYSGSVVGYLSSLKECLCIVFRLKGNQEIIKCLQEAGWKVDKRFRDNPERLFTARDPGHDVYHAGPGCVAMQKMIYIIEKL